MDESSKNNKLPVFKIISASFHLTLHHYKTLLKFAIPLAITVPLSKVTSFGLLMQTLFQILFFMALVISIVGCHRTFLLHIETKIFRWGWREIKYLGRTLILLLTLSASLLSTLIIMSFTVDMMLSISNKALPVILPGMLASLIFSLFMLYIVARFSLILPATAVDASKQRLHFSWQLTKNNGWRLTFLLGFLPLITFFILAFLSMLNPVVYAFMTIVIVCLSLAVQICLTSLSYDFLNSYSKWQNRKKVNLSPLL